MNDIEQKALEMISAARKEHPTPDNYLIARTALCRAIEQHEAFQQEVSDALLEYYGGYHNASGEPLGRFIIPKPKPDPLVEAMKKAGWGEAYINNSEPSLRAALDALGFEIREKGKER